MRLHEYGHAIIHLGMTQTDSLATAAAASQSQKLRVIDTLLNTTQRYQGVDHSVHEQIAQSVDVLRHYRNLLFLQRAIEQSKTPHTPALKQYKKIINRLEYSITSI
ncbi:hypothetical protein ACVWWG_007986 [Bradyrhizobium sp. LB7.2]